MSDSPTNSSITSAVSATAASSSPPASHSQSSATPTVPSSTSVSSASDVLPEATRFDESLTRPLTLGIGEDILLPFIEEYSKLQQALLKSHDSETRFVTKCKALTKQTRAHTHKLTALHAMYAQDQKKKSQLTQDIENKKQVLQRLHDETKEKKESVHELRNELAQLGVSLEENSADYLKTQRANIAKLEGEVNKFSLIRDKDRIGLTKVRAKNIDLFKQLQDLLAALSRSQQEYDGLEGKLLEARALSGKELRRKAELEKNMKDIQLRVADRQTQLGVKKDLIAKASKELNDVELQLVKSEKVVESHRMQYEELNESARNANESLLEIQETNETLMQQLKKVSKELEDEKGATKTAKGNSEMKLKQLELMREKVRVLSDETRAEEDSKLEAQNRMKLLKDSISNIQFKLNNNAKSMDTCVREREILAQNHMAKIDSIKSKEAALKIKNSTLKNIKNEHQGYLISIRTLTKILEDLKKDKIVHESDLNRRLIQKSRALEEVTQREVQITEYQTQILLNEGKLRQQQNLLEAVRSDRNMYRKTLIEQQNEMHEMRRKYLFLATQVKQNKSEIDDKNSFIIFEHFNLQNVKDDIDQLEGQNNTTFISLEKGETIIKTQTQQIRKLSTIISDADEELRVQIHQYNSIVNEQRVLNQQLVKRNDELARLYEQLKLQNSVLSKSAGHYKEKQILLSEYELEYNTINKTLDDVLSDIKKYASLKSTIVEVKEDLLQEQLKVKALTDELRKPINIHRWRRLMDTNTDTYTLLKKVRTLQKDIIAKQSRVDEKDEAIQEKEKLYVDLRKVLARQPGNETAEQLRIYLEQLEEKRMKLKNMKSELKLYQSKVKEYEYSLGKMKNDLELVKLSWFQKKRSEQQQRKKQQNGGATQNGWKGAAGSGRIEEEEYIPDILKPTEFPEYGTAAAEKAAQLAQQQQQAKYVPNQEYTSGVNPYLATLNGTASSATPSSTASFAAQPASHRSSASNHGQAKQMRGLDESDEEDDEDEEDEGDDEAEDESETIQKASSRGGSAASRYKFEAEEKQQPPYHSSSSSSSLTPSAPSTGAISHRPLSSSSRRNGQSSSASSSSLTQLNLATLQQQQQQQRSDSRSSARGGSALSQRGEAGYSRFPSIGGAGQASLQQD